MRAAATHFRPELSLVRIQLRMQRSSITGLLAAGVILFLAVSLIRNHAATHPSAFTSGYILIASVFFLALFNLRKKLSFLPLGRASTWMQLHIYVGIIAMAIFGMHVGWRPPNGILESCLFMLFMMTSLNGIIGLYLTRTVPRRLSKLREEIIYERIPQFRTQVRNEAHSVVVSLVSDFPSETIADYYTLRLTEYFVKPRSFFYFLNPTSRLRNTLRNELSNLQRYCSESELVAGERLSRLIDKRDDLDYHQALQGALKWWMFLHIGLTYALVSVATLHAIMAHAFRGNVL